MLFNLVYIIFFGDVYFLKYYFRLKYILIDVKYCWLKVGPNATKFVEI